MSQESSDSVDPPPSYAEAIDCVQLSPHHLTQVLMDHQWNRRQNIDATQENDNEEIFYKEVRMKRNTRIGSWIIRLAVFIFLIFVIIWITCS